MPNTVRLHCHAGNHDWDRPSQRGRRPFNCPEHSDEATPNVTTASAVPAIPDADVQAVATEKRLPVRIVRSLMTANVPVPDRGRVDRIGYTIRERNCFTFTPLPAVEVAE